MRGRFVVARIEGGGVGGLPVLSIADAMRIEGDTGNALMEFSLSLSASSDGGVTVDVATDLGSATPNVDYVPTTATLTFPDGATTATFQVPVIGDTDAEPDETFLVRLSAPVGAALGDAEATGTILDDDVPPPQAVVRPVPGPGPAALLLLGIALAAAAARRRRAR